MAAPSASPSRLSVRLTSRGWQAVVIGVAVIVVARLIGTTQLHQLGYAFLALPAASLVVGFVFARGLTFSRRVSSGEMLSAGSPAKFELVAENDSRFGTSSIDGTDNLPERTEFDFDPMPARGRASLKTSANFPRRGVYRLGPASLSVVDPFELLNFTRTFTDSTDVVVYPRVYDLPDFPVRGRNSDSGGRGSAGQRGEEFSGLREYRRGDDRRHIHWKSFARTGELYIKETSLHSPKRYTVALDLEKTGFRSLEGPVEDSVSVAASIFSQMRSDGLPLRLMHSGNTVEGDDAGDDHDGFHTDEEYYRRKMRTLSTVRVGGGETLAGRLLEDRGLGEGVVIVSRNTTDDLFECVVRLVRDGLSVVVVLIASHTYTSGGPRGRDTREGRFAGYADGLMRSGAVVRVVGHPGGVPGMAAPGAGVRA